MATDNTTYVPGQPFKGQKTYRVRQSTYRANTEEYSQWLMNKYAYYYDEKPFLSVGEIQGGNKSYEVGLYDATLNEQANLTGDVVLSESSAKALIADAQAQTSLEDYQTWFNDNADVLKFINEEDYAKIQKDFDSKKSGFTEEFLKEQLEGDNADHYKDNVLHQAVQQGKYLPNRVVGNIMDGYQVPMYYLRLFVMKKDVVARMHTNIDESAVEKIAYKIEKPDPNDIVVIAETGATDLTIDDLEIEHFSDGEDTFATTSFNWTITEPGSITLLDRMAAARNFCGYNSSGAASGETFGNRPAANGIPYFLEISLLGYPDDVDDIDMGMESAEHIIGPYIHELAYLKFDMNIGPEGAVYNFSAHPKDNIGRFSTFNRVKENINITGESLTDLLDALEKKLEQSNKHAFRNSVEKEENIPTYLINFDGLVNNPYQRNEQLRGGSRNADGTYEGRIGEYDESGDRDRLDNAMDRGAADAGSYDPAYAPDGIDNFLYVDPSRVNARTTTYAPPNTKTGEQAPGTLENTYENEYGVGVTAGTKTGSSDFLDVSDDAVQIMKNFADDSYANPDHALTDEELQEVRAVLSTPSYVTINAPAGTAIVDIIESIMSLSYDLINVATRMRDAENPEGEVDKTKTFVNWFKVTETVNYDYEKYDNKLQTYIPTIEYRVRLTKEARTDVGISTKELSMTLTHEEIASRVEEMGIAKEYLYYFTGLNDQIITLDMSFNEAFALKAPLYGSENYREQLAFASAREVNQDETEMLGLVPDIMAEADESNKEEKANNFLSDIENLFKTGGDVADSLGESIKTIANEMYLGGAYDNGDAVVEAIKGGNQDLKNEFAEQLARSEIGQQVVNATLVKSQISPQDGSTTSSDGNATVDSTTITSNVPLFASEIFPGLEGKSDDPRIEAEYERQLDEYIEQKMQVVVDSGPLKYREGPIAEVERGSVRATTFAHLMNSYKTGAVSNMKIDMEIRGDPWYMGKGNFYDGNNDEGTESDTPVADFTDLSGIAYSSGSNQFLLMIESPRKLDFDISDEDQNTGFYNYGHINYTMSGIFMVTKVISKFSGGMYTNDIQAVRMPQYETAKIEQVRKIVDGRIKGKTANVGEQIGVGTGTSADLPENVPATDNGGTD